MESSLNGKLASFRLPDILTFLNLGRKTGALTLLNGPRAAHIHFSSGAIVFAWSNQKKFRLGKVLQKKKRIASDEARRIESIMLEQGEKFGRVAVEQNVLTEDELHDFLKIQVSEILYDCFVWEQGTFQFEDEAELPAYAVTISVDLANLIMEGARRIDEWDRCQSLLPSPTMVFRVISTPEIPEKITLTLNEWKILFLLDGIRSLSDVCEQSEEEALEVYRLVYGLYANKLIEPVPEAEVLAAALIAFEDQAKEQLPAREETTGVLRDDTGLLISPQATLSYRDVERVMKAKLTLKETQAVFPLQDHEYLIGRTTSSQICLSDPGVSSIHARIYRGPQGYVLEDMNSRNGTYVNETRIEQKVLAENDTIRVGSSELVYHIVFDVKPA